MACERDSCGARRDNAALSAAQRSGRQGVRPAQLAGPCLFGDAPQPLGERTTSRSSETEARPGHATRPANGSTRPATSASRDSTDAAGMDAIRCRQTTVEDKRLAVDRHGVHRAYQHGIQDGPIRSSTSRAARETSPLTGPSETQDTMPTRVWNTARLGWATGRQRSGFHRQWAEGPAETRPKAANSDRGRERGATARLGDPKGAQPPLRGKAPLTVRRAFAPSPCPRWACGRRRCPRRSRSGCHLRPR